MHSIIRYGTIVVVIHAIIVALHGLAHEKIPVPLSLLQSLFVGSIIVLAPITAMILLWTPFQHAGSWLLLSSMAGATLFGIYYHFILISSDHISQVPFAGFGILFHITAILDRRTRMCNWRMGIKHSTAEKAGFMSHLETFNQHRSLLFAIAYRMLGTVTDAEDMVQETFLRWQQTAEVTVKSAKTYLSTIITRLCIDHLRSARVQREQYVGSWLPEPIMTQQTDDPAAQVELADSLSIAFLVVLERLSPIERAVFLLREVFDYDYDAIAQMVGKSSANCRQILRRARQHIAAQRPRFTVSHQQQEQITSQFLEASTQGNLQGLMALLAKDVTYWSDGGGQVAAALKPLQGAMKVARFLLALRSKWLSASVVLVIEINGQPGMITLVDSCIHSVTTLEIVDGYIQSIYTIRNPEKLKRICENANDQVHNKL